jgi:hypothetical protein
MSHVFVDELGQSHAWDQVPNLCAKLHRNGTGAYVVKPYGGEGELCEECHL